MKLNINLLSKVKLELHNLPANSSARRNVFLKFTAFIGVVSEYKTLVEFTQINVMQRWHVIFLKMVGLVDIGLS